MSSRRVVKMDWDSAVQTELFRLKKEAKKRDEEVKSLKKALREERDKLYRYEKECKRLREKVTHWGKKA